MNDAAPGNDYLTIRAFREAVGSDDWPVLSNGATAFFPTGSLAASARFVAAISALDGIEDHRPSIDIRADGVTVRLLTVAADWWGVSGRDVESAHRISRVAAELGLAADPSVVQAIEPLVIGAVDIPKVRPFWQALMGYEPRIDSPEEDIVDPRGIGPGVWFEQLEGPVSGRNRMHFAVWLPFEQAKARLDATIAAGGTVIYDQYAPAWWTLADPEGNESDIATSFNRDESWTSPEA